MEPFGTLTATTPSLRERLSWALAQALTSDPQQQRWIAGKAGGTADIVPGLDVALGADDTLNSLKEGNYLGAAGNAGSTLVGSVPGVGDVVAAGLKALPIEAIFAGMSAKTVNGMYDSPVWDRVEQATKMAHEGVTDPAEIWDQTQLMLGPDNRTRWELDDRGAILDPDFVQAIERGGGVARLPDIFQHNEFYKNYPEFENYVVDMLPNTPEYETVLGMVSSGDMFSPTRISMATPEKYALATLSQGRDRSPLGTLLHEAQHGVQQIEGFTGGSNPSYIRELAGPEISQAIQDFPQVFSPNERSLIEFLGRHDETKDMITRALYNRSFGEAEARNVDFRKAFTPDDRRFVPPWESSDEDFSRLVKAEDVFTKLADRRRIASQSVPALSKPRP